MKLFPLPLFEGDAGAAAGGAAPAADAAPVTEAAVAEAPAVSALAVPEGMKRNRFGTLSADPDYKGVDVAPAQPAVAPAAEAKVDAPKTETPAVETPAPAYDAEALMADLKREVIGLPVSDAKELPAYVRELQTGAELSGEIKAMAGESPEFASFLTLVAQGKSIDVAAREAFAAFAEEPDPADDPEGYRRYTDRQAEKRAAAQTAKQQQQAEAQQAEALGSQVRKSFDAFTQRMAETEGYDDGTFRKEAQSLLYGDATTGRYRGDAPDIIYRGLNHDTLVKAAVEKATAEVTERVLNEVRAGKHTPAQSGDGADSMPSLGGGGLGADVDLSSLGPDGQAAFGMAGRLGFAGGPQKNRFGTYS